MEGAENGANAGTVSNPADQAKFPDSWVQQKKKRIIEDTIRRKKANTYLETPE